jgi:hypothetical protein
MLVGDFVGLVNGRNTVTNAIGAGMRIYRLRR